MGAGARISWSINSRKALYELSLLLEGEQLERLEFEDGERLREIALEKYKSAQTNCKESEILRTSNLEKFKLETEAFIKSKITTDQAFIFLQRSESRGIYKTNRKTLEKYSVRILIYDGNCVQITSENLESGILLDLEKVSNNLTWYESYYWSV
ncbi:hypothetical protein D9M68_271780 [compost metagenome]